MADKTYDNAIRRDERERLATLLTDNADMIESFAAPGAVVRMIAFLLTLDHPNEDVTE